MYKLLALDLDGTILDENLNISQRIQNAIKKASYKLKVSLCTGRSEKEVVEFSKNLNLKSHHICENGAKLIDENGKIIFSSYIRKEGFQKSLQILKKNPNFIYFFCCNGVITERIPINLNSVSRITIFNLSQKNLTMFIKAFSSISCLQLFSYTHNNKLCLDIQSLEISKGKALKTLKKIYNISSKEVVYIGDGLNDIEPFQEAALKIAMQNGHPKLKNIADFICPSIKNDGVSIAIEKFLL